jgi:hypothetical protein
MRGIYSLLLVRLARDCYGELGYAKVAKGSSQHEAVPMLLRPVSQVLFFVKKQSRYIWCVAALVQIGGNKSRCFLLVSWYLVSMIMGM